MLRNLTISLAIPCHNEEDGIQLVIARVPGVVDEVIVVDNNCTDRTAAVASTGGAKVIQEKVPGYGAACKAGMYAATGDIIVTLDGDGSYPPEAIPGLVDIMLDRNLEFLSTSRFPLVDRRAMELTNRVGNFVLSMVASLLFQRWFRDSQSGMWFVRKRTLERMQLTSDGMPFSEEIKLEAIRLKVPYGVEHIPYRERIGVVKLRKWRDGWRNLVFLFRKRLNML